MNQKTCPTHPNALIYPGVGGRRCMECNMLVTPDPAVSAAPSATVTAQPLTIAPHGLDDCAPVNHDMSALSIAKYSSGQFVSECGPDGSIIFKDEQKIDLFGYGIYEVLPREAGFFPNARLATEDGTTTNCLRGGKLCAPGSSYMIVGLAARVGQAYLPNMPTQPWLSAIDLAIRECIAESTAVDLLYDDRCFRYELGTLTQRPLNGVVFGPNVKLDGEPWMDEQINENKLFVPFKRPAVSSDTDHASIRLTIGRGIRFPSSSMLQVVVPVKVWLFGYPFKQQESIMCTVPK